ncbi:chromosome transmission fidelity protein 18 homolog isoform X2 [Ceratina calcarata]|uniref:Chromosome transmission fidelity protein 18 homolog isoform X2 n=1 Tax=Ceratina calcarata TaxID=156304 RepID=A0AAJ7J9B1_9HYME|nr:chromosome transmission fidelity protein 18 homolog isoform X2 [Ceratina calcarata]
MSSEFPDPDDEFDLIHEEEYEILREIEELKKKKDDLSRNVGQSQEKLRNKNELNSATPNLDKDLNTPSCSIQSELHAPSTSKNNGNVETDIIRKRNYDELFGDISDILDINDFVVEPREKKPRWDDAQQVIKAVLDSREKFHEVGKGISVRRKHEESKRDTISLRVPHWNFVAVTRPVDAERIYVRVKNDEQVEIKKSNCIFSGLLSVPFGQLKAEAEEIIVQNVKKASCETFNISTTATMNDDELWVDKYRPRSFLDLLSDENVNRSLLHWLKLWDKVVFNRNYEQSKRKKPNFALKNRNRINAFRTFNNRKTEFMFEKPIDEVDSRGFPVQRIVLLTGPPGLGKTTLAHLAAKHAGYNVVEINASDERSPDAFREVLLASTQMKAVMGSDPRPNCLILDEIDGAPAASIDLLLKFVQGKLIEKGKKVKANKQTNVCHRPVICICNELYTPSLRALRMSALVIPVPEVSPARLADRLIEIAEKENLNVSPDALIRLAEVSSCDIRSCLGALQYMGGTKFKDDFSSALKDSRRGLFDSWKQILTIPVTKGGILPIPQRVQLVLKTVRNGESEKLASGIFHNYIKIRNDKWKYIVLCLHWFEFFDEISSMVASCQNWSIMPYLNYAFVTWHLYLAKAKTVTISYPSTMYEMKQKLERSEAILTTVHRCSGRDSTILAIDYAPFFPDLLNPLLRTVSGHLHSNKERNDINRLVDILLDFGLTFTQEKSIDGSYNYKLDPDVFEIGIFPECKNRRMLAYAAKQLILQELEAERVRRAANITNNKSDKDARNNAPVDRKPKSNITESKSNTTESKSSTIGSKSNPMEQSNRIKAGVKEIQYKDFFGRPITVDQAKEKDKGSVKSGRLSKTDGTWYRYKDGFSNAVRRFVRMEKLL